MNLPIYLEYPMLVVISYGIAWGLSRLFKRSIGILISKNKDVDPTNFIFIQNSISILLYTIATVWIFSKVPYLKTLGNALFAGAGVLAAVIGFASQKAFSNIIGGLFILLFKPFRVGDIIEISNSRIGVVESISLRHTIIRDYESRRVVIPNSQISEETIINSSLLDQRIRKFIDISVGYDTDLDQAIRILTDFIENHPNFLDNRTQEDNEAGKPKVDIKVIELGNFSITLRAFVWALNNGDAFTIKCDILKNIKTEFDKVGIEIPYPYQNVVVKQGNQTSLYPSPQLS